MFAREGRGIVREVGEGELAQVIGVSRDVRSRDQGGLFEVAVGEVPVGVGGGDHARLALGGEGCPPDEWGVTVDEDDTAHAWLGGVNGLEGRRFFGKDLGEAGRSRAEVLSEAFEVIKVVPDEGGDADAVGFGFGDAQLEGAEEARAAWDANAHEAELAQVLLPLAQADTVLATKVIEDFLEAKMVVRWELDGAQDHVEDPA